MSDDRPHEKREPHYDLAGVQRDFALGRFDTTERVARYLHTQGWSRGTIRPVICAMSGGDFYKSQAHVKRDGVWLDIYRPYTGLGRMYVKFSLSRTGCGYIVLSFCRDGEPH